MKAGQKIIVIVFLALFALTGLLTYKVSLSPSGAVLDFRDISLPDMKILVMGIHLYCWMIAGILANYLWDLFSAGKRLGQIDPLAMTAPLLVSPIVYLPIYTLFSEQPIKFAMFLTAFQNGFFWQSVFNKAAKSAAKD